MDILINTAEVLSTADQIDTINKKIREDLANLDSAIKTLKNNWEGEASNSCTNRYDYIKNSFSDSRFTVVNEMVYFMRSNVGEEYERLEKTLVDTAASAFK